MYLREKRIKLLKIKNIIFVIIGMFCVASSVFVLTSLISYYRDDLKIVLEAKATPDCVKNIIIGMILLVIAGISRRRIGDANFYSSYFEGDLSGYIQYGDLAEVTGKSEGTVKRQLHFFRKIYMKGYELEMVDHIEQIVLNSKKCICECKNCAGLMEKRIYFTGVCPYCGSSDLFARVLTNNRFYSIENRMSKGVKNPEFYSVKNITMKKKWFLLYLCLGLFAAAIGMIICLGNIADYNNQEYLKEVLLSGKSHYSSFALIKAEIMDNIIMGGVLALAFIPVVTNRFKKIKYISAADNCSQYFSRCKTPFVNAQNLPVAPNISNKGRGLKLVRGAIRQRYLLNCTFEKHDGVLKVALAKKIVKDQCPSCGGAIVGAVDEHYKCRYCGNIIMGVIRKNMEAGGTRGE